jgi:hypothetical protein
MGLKVQAGRPSEDLVGSNGRAPLHCWNQGLRGASPWLEQQFDRAAEEAERSMAVRTSRIITTYKHSPFRENINADIPGLQALGSPELPLI